MNAALLLINSGHNIPDPQEEPAQEPPDHLSVQHVEESKLPPVRAAHTEAQKPFSRRRPGSVSKQVKIDDLRRIQYNVLQCILK